jgi:hypothetical protein
MKREIPAVNTTIIMVAIINSDYGKYSVLAKIAHSYGKPPHSKLHLQCFLFSVIKVLY